MFFTGCSQETAEWKHLYIYLFIYYFSEQEILAFAFDCVESNTSHRWLQKNVAYEGYWVLQIDLIRTNSEQIAGKEMKHWLKLIPLIIAFVEQQHHFLLGVLQEGIQWSLFRY